MKARIIVAAALLLAACGCDYEYHIEVYRMPGCTPWKDIPIPGGLEPSEIDYAFAPTGGVVTVTFTTLKEGGKE